MTSPTSELGLESLTAECRFVEEQHRDTPSGASRRAVLARWKPRLDDEHDVYAWCTSTEARATPLLAARSGHTHHLRATRAVLRRALSKTQRLSRPRERSARAHVTQHQT